MATRNTNFCWLVVGILALALSTTGVHRFSVVLDGKEDYPLPFNVSCGAIGRLYALWLGNNSSFTTLSLMSNFPGHSYIAYESERMFTWCVPYTPLTPVLRVEKDDDNVGRTVNGVILSSSIWHINEGFIGMLVLSTAIVSYAIGKRVHIHNLDKKQV